MKRLTANNRLKQHGGSCFLTRYSTTRSVYVLSTLQVVGSREHHSRRRTTSHFNIVIAGESSLVKFEGTRTTFQDVSILYEHYQNAPLGNKIDGIGECIRSGSLSTSSSISGVSFDEEIEINFDGKQAGHVLSCLAGLPIMLTSFCSGFAKAGLAHSHEMEGQVPRKEAGDH